MRGPDHAVLYDYRLGREFTITDATQTFTSVDSVATLAFRVLERQNRSLQTRALTGAGAGAQVGDDCDAESELGVVIPQMGHARTEFRDASGRTEFRCNGRDMGGFTSGTGAFPPNALWPTMMFEMTVHPALFQHVRDMGRAPSELTITMAHAPIDAVSRTWRLISSETIDVSYPLAAPLVNANRAAIDAATGPGVGAIAADAVAGRALGGAPTVESWNAYVSSLATHRPNEPAMLISMSFSMFPELQAGCAQGMRHAICDAFHNLRATLSADPAVTAMYYIAEAEQRDNVASVVDPMRRAQASPLGRHPALGQAYALALLKFDDPAMAQARQAHLPTEPLPLMAATLQAYPYNPDYWTDIADYYAQGLRWGEATMLYDVAFALPMPSAQQNNPLLAARRAFRARLRHDFPDYSLP